ncbi:Vitamin K-dependent gamma-carboxylase [Tistlia consotensis]|uniref:Vitamin K-dependent gamma-carboxylase n=1 Tax=Tistlia consotensis USBA 355 TaxID=560819 RepID=A0A1Y6CHV3_9PROT|nr:HTTM domain-containing protein [Tistlia consotensis]SMF63308.1 Vitamin K-dependent gamma-carboxylase [Tistlia consotensis USBA 355]SNR96010.1 Vitamin K-dependent gamma-carboxylase [Tistlia consotensis]
MARARPSADDWPAPSRARKRLVLGLIAAWLALQVLVPARHWLYPGNPSWTEEGHRFAWMMKLRDKLATADFTVRDPATGRTWQVDSSQFLEPWQARKMATWPDLVRQFAHYLAAVWVERHGVAGAEVRARVCVSLNGRPPQLLVDPTIDLAAQPHSWGPDDWILPLGEPFARPPDRRGRHDLAC